MPTKAQWIAYKVIAVLMLVFIVNVIFIFVFPTVLNSLYFAITLIAFNFFISLDKIFQPAVIYGKKERSKEDLKKSIFLLLFLVANPFMFTMAFVESNFLLKPVLSPEVMLAFWVPGILIMSIGGSILCASRYILGKEATLIIGVEKDHKLITKGPYHYVRHPIYAGVILLLFGYALSFSSLISPIVLLLVVVPWFRIRMGKEETLLTQTFGTEYVEYMKHTKRLFPGIY